MKMFWLTTALLVLAGFAAGCNEPKAVMPTQTIAAPKDEPQNIGMPKG